jgi:hypothetical protein
VSCIQAACGEDALYGAASHRFSSQAGYDIAHVEGLPGVLAFQSDEARMLERRRRRPGSPRQVPPWLADGKRNRM